MATSLDDSLGESIDAKLATFIEEQRKANSQLFEFLERTERRYRSINSELSDLKGGYAINTALGSANRIANDLGFQFISQVPWQEISAFGNLALSGGEPTAEVQSFRNADMVLLVQDSYTQSHYLAVEVSYRIDGEDIRRAGRNAIYLERFTTMPSLGAVVGVIVTASMQREAEAKNVKWYRIRPT